MKTGKATGASAVRPWRAKPPRGSALRGQILGRQALALLVLAGLALALRDRIAALDLARIGAALANVTPAQWGLGLGLTVVSYQALGRYDALVHRALDTGVATRTARLTGMSAIAIAQSVGLGMISGALVRWRLLPGLTLAMATTVSVAVSLSFLAAWAVLAAGAVLIARPDLPGLGLLAGGVGLAALLGAGLSVVRPGWAEPLHLPPLGAMAQVLGLTALDTLAAGLVLWVLLPAELSLAPLALLAAYLLALGAGLVLTTPGGLGPFEVALLALLPDVPPEPVLAAVIAYRVVYHVVPAGLALVVLIRPPRPAPAPVPPRLDPLAAAPHLPFLAEAVIAQAPRAEAALLRHGRLGLLSDRAGRPVAMAAVSGQSLLVLSDPLRRGADARAALDTIAAAAEARLRAPVIYKAGGRLAAAARARGWRVVAVAQEAWLAPAAFALDTPDRRQLRRKLRKAEAAGLVVTAVSPAAPCPLPLDEMATLAASWARAHGGERGFSMGVWAPETLAWAEVLLARDAAGVLQGFITLHRGGAEWTLDLMRAQDDAPEGTMHLLVAEAIAAAARAGVARLSLAAVPIAATQAEPPLSRWLRHKVEAASGGAGLRQFKSAFAPDWETLYLAAPGRRALILGAIDLAREIRRPGPGPGFRPR